MKSYILYFLFAVLFCACTNPLPLEDLSFINQNLVADISALDTTLQKARQNISKRVKIEGNPLVGLEDIKRAEEVALKTKILTDKMNQIKKTIENKKDLSNKNIVYQTFILQKQGKLLENLLQSHITWLNQKYKDILDEPFEFSFATSKDKDFVQTNFSNTTQIEAMSFLNYLQTQIKRYEGEVLKKLGGFHFSKRISCGFNLPISALSTTNILNQNTEYQADIFYDKTLNYLDDEIEIKSLRINDEIKNLNLQNDYVWNWQFEPSKIGKHTWQAEIQTSKDGKDTTFVLNGIYEVLPKK